MKKTKNTYWVRIVALLCILLPISASAQNPHIDLSVTGSGDAAKIQFLNSACPQEPGNRGCVELGHGMQNHISWELDQDSWQAGWRLTALFFSPDGSHWGENDYPLNDCTMEDFELAGGDRYTGQASSAMVVANGKRLRIMDLNKNVCDTWYRIFATNINGDQADSDPIIKNRGGN